MCPNELPGSYGPSKNKRIKKNKKSIKKLKKVIKALTNRLTFLEACITIKDIKKKHS